MKLLDIQQNTKFWKNWRRSKIGASECAAIMGKNPFLTPYGLWSQKIYGEEEFYNSDMQRGHDLEDRARSWLSEKFSAHFEPICAESEERSWQIASFDARADTSDGALYGEIKAPRLKKIFEIQKKGIPDYWLWQMQHQLCVSGEKSMIFLAYSPEHQYFEIVERNERMIEDLLRHEEIFYYDYMCSFTPPPMLEEESKFIRLYA